jgi:hypothetical protein
LQNFRYQDIFDKTTAAGFPAQKALQELGNKNKLLQQYHQGIQEAYQKLQNDVLLSGTALDKIGQAYTQLDNELGKLDDQFGVKLRKKMAALYKPPQVRQGLKAVFGAGADLNLYDDGSLGGSGRVRFLNENQLTQGEQITATSGSNCFSPSYSDASVLVNDSLFPTSGSPVCLSDPKSGKISLLTGALPDANSRVSGSIGEYLRIDEQTTGIKLSISIDSQFLVVSAAGGGFSLGGLDLLVELFGAGGTIQRATSNLGLSLSAVASAGSYQVKDSFHLSFTLENNDPSQEYLVRVSLLGTALTSGQGWSSVFCQSRLTEICLQLV